jgi:hypothetical protein
MLTRGARSPHATLGARDLVWLQTLAALPVESCCPDALTAGGRSERQTASDERHSWQRPTTSQGVSELEPMHSSARPRSWVSIHTRARHTLTRMADAAACYDGSPILLGSTSAVAPGAGQPAKAELEA